MTKRQFHHVFVPIVLLVWSLIVAGLAATIVYFSCQ